MSAEGDIPPGAAAPAAVLMGEDAIRAAIENAEFIPPAPEGPPDDGAYPLRGGGDDPIDLRLARKLRNDVGNAQRFMTRFGTDFLHVEEVGWHVWTGSHWDQSTGTRQAQLAAHKTALAIFDEAQALEGAGPIGDEGGKEFEKRVGGLRAFASSSGNSNRIVAMVKEAAPYLSRRPDEMDADPLLFNLRNGTLRLAPEGGGGVRLLNHRREDAITRAAPVQYDPEAVCPTFLRFLDQILPDREVQGFLQRWWGYCLTGEMSEQQLVMLYGTGANGKSTLLELMAFILGAYAESLPFASLLQDDRKRGSEASPDLARLPGKRLVSASEADVGAKLSESLIKQLTGQDRVTVRHLHKGFFSFDPTFKLMLSFNHKPGIRGQDEGIWRRIVLVPFDRVIPKEQRDPRLQAKLRAEASGVLNWMLDGYRLWAEGGLQVPDAAREATQEYRSDSDPVGRFLGEAVRRVPGATVPASALYKGYCQWCGENAVTPVTQTLFGRVMSDKGFRKVKVGLVSYQDVDLDSQYMTAVNMPPMDD